MNLQPCLQFLGLSTLPCRSFCKICGNLGFFIREILFDLPSFYCLNCGYARSCEELLIENANKIDYVESLKYLVDQGVLSSSIFSNSFIRKKNKKANANVYTSNFISDTVNFVRENIKRNLKGYVYDLEKYGITFSSKERYVIASKIIPTGLENNNWNKFTNSKIIFLPLERSPGKVNGYLLFDSTLQKIFFDHSRDPYAIGVHNLENVLREFKLNNYLDNHLLIIDDLFFYIKLMSSFIETYLSIPPMIYIGKGASRKNLIPRINVEGFKDRKGILITRNEETLVTSNKFDLYVNVVPVIERVFYTEKLKLEGDPISFSINIINNSKPISSVNREKISCVGHQDKTVVVDGTLVTERGNVLYIDHKNTRFPLLKIVRIISIHESISDLLYFVKLKNNLETVTVTLILDHKRKAINVCGKYVENSLSRDEFMHYLLSRGDNKKHLIGIYCRYLYEIISKKSKSLIYTKGIRILSNNKLQMGTALIDTDYIKSGIYFPLCLKFPNKIDERAISLISNNCRKFFSLLFVPVVESLIKKSSVHRPLLVVQRAARSMLIRQLVNTLSVSLLHELKDLSKFEFYSSFYENWPCFTHISNKNNSMSKKFPEVMYFSYDDELYEQKNDCVNLSCVSSDELNVMSYAVLPALQRLLSRIPSSNDIDEIENSIFGH